MGKQKVYGLKVIRASCVYLIVAIVQACIIIACVGAVVGSCCLDNEIKIEGEILNGEM